MNRLRRLRHDQSGMSYVFIGMGMMAFMSASMLAEVASDNTRRTGGRMLRSRLRTVSGT